MLPERWLIREVGDENYSKKSIFRFITHSVFKYAYWLHE